MTGRMHCCDAMGGKAKCTQVPRERAKQRNGQNHVFHAESLCHRFCVPSLSFCINLISGGLGVAFVWVPSVSCGAWHMVGLDKYLCNHFLPTPMFIVSNT